MTTRILSVMIMLAGLFACGEADKVTQQSLVSDKTEVSSLLILVTGVTGRQGGAVAKALLESNFTVRGLTRNATSERAQRMEALGIELVEGNFDEHASLDKAMQGVHGVYSVQNFWEHGYDKEVQQGKNVADAALRAGVKHFVFSSVANADDKTGIPHFDSKYETELYVQSLEMPFTIFRPVSFMENWEYSRESIVAGKLNSPFSLSTRLQQISVKDIGRFVALAFSKPEEWTGVTLDIAGQEYSLKEVVNLFSRITGSPVEFTQTPWEEFEQNAGAEMAIMDRWIDSVGYSANVNLVQSKLENMTTLEEYLFTAGWAR